MNGLVRQWFLVSLLAILAVGIVGAPACHAITELKWPQNCLTFAVMFLMALSIDSRAFVRSIARPAPALLASVMNMVVVPLVAWCASLLLPLSLGIGLQVATIVPCTLASAAVWTRRAGGNDAAAVIVMLLTNGTCFLTTPLWLLVMTGQSVARPELSFGRMSWMLLLLVVFPLCLAQLLRTRRRISQVADRRSSLLAILAQIGILLMVFLGAVHSGASIRIDSGLALVWIEWLALVCAIVFVHLGSLGVGVLTAAMLGMTRQDQIAVGFAGSQKTLMVGIALAISLRVSVLPMVGYQVLQLVLDAVIADRWSRASGICGREEGGTRRAT